MYNTPDGGINLAAVLITLALAFMFYFFPALMAQGRNHKHRTAIWVANTVFGWTILGWLVVLVWAFMNQREAEA